MITVTGDYNGVSYGGDGADRITVTTTDGEGDSVDVGQARSVF